MPLIRSAAKENIGPNIKAEMAAGKPQRQAIAIALDVQRRAKRAFGGPNPGMMSMPWYAKREAYGMLHTGPIMSPVAGRTDHIPLSVPAGSYVIPSQAVSHLGQNNSAAGFARLNNMFSSGPFGTALPKMGRGAGLPRPPGMPRQPAFALGGYMEGGIAYHGKDDEPVEIMAAGGEFVIHPAIVRTIGHGSISEGHRILDQWIKSLKEDHIKTLKKLPGPAK